ncbi:MAG: ArsA family ATPase [Nitrospirae bacterium]|nr:ArsA family ATPase [Nitrospirota bacterium]
MAAHRTRILVYVGKGGVGKTTLVAATALHLARRGIRTLALSTDPAHTLGDLLGSPPLGEIRSVSPNLHVLELSPYAELERRSEAVLRYLRRLMAGRGYHDMILQELLSVPGADEVVALLRIKELAAEGRWDAVVVDTASSGAALKLFLLPEAAHWYMQRIYPGEKKLLLMLKPLAEKITASPLPDAPVYDALEALYSDLVEVKDRLKDRRTTSFRLVLTPEKLVVQESMRIYSYLSMHGFHTDAVIVNRAGGEYDPRPMRERFEGLRMLRIPPVPRDPDSKATLLEMARQAYGKTDPLKRLANVVPIEYETADGSVSLYIRMAGLRKSELKIFTRNRHLVLQARNVRRLIALPDAFENYVPRRARVEQGVLKVEFQPA